MKRTVTIALLLLLAVGCHRQKFGAVLEVRELKATGHGTAITQVSGDKQIGTIGNTLDQPVVVQVNDAQGNAVTGAAVIVTGPAGVVATPSIGLTDASGQFTTTVRLGQTAGRYEITAATPDPAGKSVEVKLTEIALGWQQTLGAQLNQAYCDRCHNPESTPERVSNYDNLDPKPHAFTEGDTLNKMSDADLEAIISHGGTAVNKSPQMPPYGYTLSKSDIQALIAYIRAIADPPYRTAGVVYAKQ